MTEFVQHYLELREQWFILSQEQADGLQEIGQDVLKLEASRSSSGPLHLCFFDHLCKLFGAVVATALLPLSGTVQYF